MFFLKLKYFFYLSGYLLCCNGINIKFNHKTKKIKMKKLLFAAIIGASFSMVACGESTTTTATDSTKVVTVDSTKMSADTTKMDTTKMDTTKKMMADTTKK
jgi:hypothetical protein